MNVVICPHLVSFSSQRSVYISDAGEPLLADFGVSKAWCSCHISPVARLICCNVKMIADITDVPFTQSQGVADAYRWLAPECWEGEGILSIKSDIHSYGMTVLEVRTLSACGTDSHILN
jgi:hypothetical protein